MVKRIGNIFNKIYDKNNILQAHLRAKENKGHYIDVQYVDSNLEECINKIHHMLKNETYTFCPQEYKRKDIVDKGKKRTLYIAPYFPHRIIQWAIVLVLGDALKKKFISTSYASIKGRGQLKASLDLRNNIRHHDYYLQLDIEKFYPNVDRENAKKMLERIFKDRKLLNLLYLIIDSAPEEKGLPLGSLLSQWLGNLYMTPLDRYIKQDLKTKSYFRYCDDLILLGGSRQELNKKLKKIENFAKERLFLNVKPTYRLKRVEEGIDFVGYVHYPNKTLLRRRNKYAIRRLFHKLNNKMKSRQLTEKDISRLSSYIGWTKHCDCDGLYSAYIAPILERWKKMNYKDKTVQSNQIPEPLEVTPTAVYVRSNVTISEIDGESIYTYKESKYSKDGYIKKQQELLDEQEAVLIDIDFRLTSKEMEGLM